MNCETSKIFFPYPILNDYLQKEVDQHCIIRYEYFIQLKDTRVFISARMTFYVCLSGKGP